MSAERGTQGRRGVAAAALVLGGCAALAAAARAVLLQQRSSARAPAPPPAPAAAPGESEAELRAVALRCRAASRALQALPSSGRVAILTALADGLLAGRAAVLAANAEDVAAAEAGGVAPALLSRLRLTPAKLAALAAGVRAVAAQPEPLGRVLSRTLVADGLVLEKARAAAAVQLRRRGAPPATTSRLGSAAL